MLSTDIDKLFNAMGGADKPAYDKVRSKLSDFSFLVKALEEGQSTLQAEAEVAALKSEIERVNKETETLSIQRQTERQEFEFLLQAANAEIERFRAEQKKRDCDYGLEELEHEILTLLGNLNCKVTTEDITAVLQKHPVMVSHHLDVLRDGNFVFCYPPQAFNASAGGWKLSKKGRAYYTKRCLPKKADTQ